MINATVRPYFNEAVLKEACKCYGIDSAEAKLIRGNSNLVFDCGTRFLRFTHSRIRSEENIMSEIAWLNFLLKEKLSVVCISASLSGNHFERIGNDEYFSVVCFEKIDGIKITRKEWNCAHFSRMGSLLGKLHRAGQVFTKRSAQRYKNWNELTEYKNYKYLKLINPYYSDLHEVLVKEFSTYPKTPTNYGLVHYDVHHGNYMVADGGKRLVLFDFELACKSWYVSDVAAVLYYAGQFEGRDKAADFEAKFMTHFWKGYDCEFSLSKVEKDRIPKFLLYRDLLVLGFVASIWDLSQLTEPQEKYIDLIKASIKGRSSLLSLSGK